MVKIYVYRKDGFIQSYNVKNTVNYIKVYEDGVYVKKPTEEKAIKKEIKRERIRKEEIAYFYNFNFAGAGFNALTGSGVHGYMVTPFPLSLNDARVIIRRNIPRGWIPINLYSAQDFGAVRQSQIVIFRDGREIFIQNV